MIVAGLLACALATPAGATAQTETLRFRDEALLRVVKDTSAILRTQNPKTGRFGKGIWIVEDQNVIYPLAVAWSAKRADNPCYHDARVLNAIMAGGDALIADADSNGQFEFRKKDGSTWGKISMPWTYSRWLRAYGLVRDGMPPERRRKWEQALTRGYSYIAKHEISHVHNIPTHHAMGLYLAGELLNRPDWREEARKYMAKAVAAQAPGGYWSEHSGPVVKYNFVYVEAIGIYYALSHDQTVLPALQRAARFHATMLYPSGASVETVDERNPFSAEVAMGNVGFTFCGEGRGYLAHQWAIGKQSGVRPSPDAMASFFLYGQEGPITPIPASGQDGRSVIEDSALVQRKGPWFISLSAYHAPISTARWIQDRQNLVSIYHDRCGLILGGGNTKLQPLWSTFTVGDTSLLKHTPGDTNPDFLPKGELYHVPSAAALKQTDPSGLTLSYGKEKTSLEVEPVDAHTLKLHLQATAVSGLPVAAHLTLIPHMGEALVTAAGERRTVQDAPFELSGKETGGWMEHAGWRLSVPDAATVRWPVLPHNSYVKDGSAKPAEGRIVLSLPFSQQTQEYTLTLWVD